jgi:peptidoglycan/xylan/chitin deacetylase (PgdA/CDA1 family)
MTSQLLSFFKQHSTQATFYVWGENVQQYPQYISDKRQC